MAEALPVIAGVATIAGGTATTYSALKPKPYEAQPVNSGYTPANIKLSNPYASGSLLSPTAYNTYQRGK